jgi:thioredoxin 1
MKTKFFVASFAIISVILLIAVKPVNSEKPQKIVDNVYQLTDQDFDTYTKSGIVLVDFWAVWCGPCRTQGPIIDDIAKDIGKKALIAKVNVDAARVTSARYSIKYIPTIMIFKNGELAFRYTGVQSKETLMAGIDSLQKL